MKKLLALVLTAALLVSAAFALASCGKKEVEVTVTVIDPNGFAVVDGVSRTVQYKKNAMIETLAGNVPSNSVKGILIEMSYLHISPNYGTSTLNVIGCTDCAYTITVNGEEATLGTLIEENPVEIVITCAKAE